MMCHDLGPLERVLAVNPFLTVRRDCCLKRLAQYNAFVKALPNVSQIYILHASNEPLICGCCAVLWDDSC